MKVKIKYSHWYVKLIGMGGFTLYPWIMLAQSREELEADSEWFRTLIKHEMIHIKQVREKGWVKFYFTYLWEYATNFIKSRNRNRAYMDISYEVEAYRDQYQDFTPEELEELKGQIYLD